MLYLQFVTVLLAISCGLIRTGQNPPPPPPTPPPTTTPIPGCSHDPACENTYTTAVVQGNACQASEAYLVCAEAMKVNCGQGAVPSNVIGIINHAEQAVTQKCNITLPALPGCASGQCLPYESAAIAQHASNLTSQACGSSRQYIQCLQDHIDTGTCDVISYRNTAQTAHTQLCGGPFIPTSTNNGTNTGNGVGNGGSRISYISNILLLFSLMIWTA